MPVFHLLKDTLSLVTTALLILCGGFFCARLRAFVVLHPIRMLRLVLEKGHAKKSLRAFTLALAGTLGVGNIAGVAIAISFGGAGALFWMWVCGIFAMFLKYAEVSLALDDKARGGDGFGYIRRAFGKKRTPLFFFAVLLLLLSFSMGAMIQSNAIASASASVFPISRVLVGVLLFLATFGVIFGGTKRISSVTFRLVPLASVLYICACVCILCMRFDALGKVFASIFASAFAYKAGAFGVLGFLFSRAFRQGGMCGLLSNEAGCGTAPLAHATAETSPARQGVWGVLEVFVDTIILCTLTGLVLLVSLEEIPFGVNGVDAVSFVFVSFFGVAGGMLLFFCVCLFAFATVLCWSFYGVRALSLFSKKETSRKRYLLAFCLCVGLGALFTPSFVFAMTDIILSLMTVLHIWVLFSASETVCAISQREGLISHSPKRADAHKGQPSPSKKPPALQ